MTMLRITAGPYAFTARMEEADAPATCAAFRKLLPYRQKLIHARWSGEACWIPLGDFKLGVDFENHTSHPSRGDILFYPGGLSETEPCSRGTRPARVRSSVDLPAPLTPTSPTTSPGATTRSRSSKRRRSPWPAVRSLAINVALIR